jgi:hemerythrin-like domain-containing protein
MAADGAGRVTESAKIRPQTPTFMKTSPTPRSVEGAPGEVPWSAGAPRAGGQGALMLTTIGTRPRNGDVVDQLLDCHDRIRFFTDLARRLGEARRPPSEEVASVAGQVRRYFAQALPVHVENEDRSLAPRLTGRDPAVDDELATMGREHWEQGELVGRLTEFCAQLECSPGSHAMVGPALAETARDLLAFFSVHLGREEHVIFPAVRRLLSPAELAAVSAETRERSQEASSPVSEPSHQAAVPKSLS